MEVYERMRLAQDLAEALQSVECHKVTKVVVEHTEIELFSQTDEFRYNWRLVQAQSRGHLLIARRTKNTTLHYSWPYGDATEYATTGAEAISLMSTYSRTGSFEEKQPA